MGNFETGVGIFLNSIPSGALACPSQPHWRRAQIAGLCAERRVNLAKRSQLRPRLCLRGSGVLDYGTHREVSALQFTARAVQLAVPHRRGAPLGDLLEELDAVVRAERLCGVHDHLQLGVVQGEQRGRSGQHV